MTDNIRIQTVDGERWIRTSEIGGVHHPHHIARLSDGLGVVYSPGYPVPVSIFSADGSATITLSGGDLAVGLDHTEDSITIWAHTNAAGSGSPVAVVVDTDGHLQVDVLSSDWPQQPFDEPVPAEYSGMVMLGVQTGSPEAQATDGAFAPFQFDKQGRLIVSIDQSYQGGALKLVSATKTSPFVVWEDDVPASLHYVDVYRCSGTYTIGLPSPADPAAADGRVVWIKNIGTGMLTLSPEGGTLELKAGLLLASRSSITLRSNTVDDWEIL